MIVKTRGRTYISITMQNGATLVIEETTGGEAATVRMVDKGRAPWLAKFESGAWRTQAARLSE